MPRWWNKVKGFVGRHRRRIKKAILRRFAVSSQQTPALSRSIASRALAVPLQRYRLESRKGWTYKEAHPQPTNGFRHFTTSVSPLPHLVLRDSQNVPRFTLSYRVSGNGIQLEEIQRCHTVEWESVDEHPHQHAKRETLASNAFRASLQGVYPPEFLLIHFLRAHRREILGGTKLAWQWNVYHDRDEVANNAPNTLYPPLARHYFRQVGVPNPSRGRSDISRWTLDLTKARTREALNLKRLKKK